MKASFTPAAAQPSASARRARGKVVTYDEARTEGNAQLISEMDRLMDKIDRTPDNYEAVAAFCNGPLEQFGNLARDFERFFAALPCTGPLDKDRMRQLEKMGLARVEIARDINLHLGVVPEVLRRYSDEYIPQYQVRANDTSDPEDTHALNDVCRRKENLIARHALLENTRLLGIGTAQYLRQMMEANDAAFAHECYAKQIRPGLDKWREARAGGRLLLQVAAPGEQLQNDIKVMKPLRLKTAPSA